MKLYIIHYIEPIKHFTFSVKVLADDESEARVLAQDKLKKNIIHIDDYLMVRIEEITK